jgi:hypothetical protein
MIFLSDGVCSVTDEAIQDVCHSAVTRGWVSFPFSNGLAHWSVRKPLSFHAVSFGRKTSTNTTLRRMAQLALEIQNNAPHDPLLPAASMIPSSFSTALDTVSTFAPLADEKQRSIANIF